MILWIALVILAALTVVALIRPLLSRDLALTGGDDREVYAAQLDELEADRARGVIAQPEADAARTEIARRLLRSRDAHASGVLRGPMVPVALAVALFVPLFALGAYLWLGTPDYGDQPLAARIAPVDNATLTDLLAQAERRLEAEPDDGEGWLAVAPIYQRLGRFSDAATAYGRVNALLGERAPWLIAQGESLTFADGGAVSDKAAALFERALVLDPQALRPAIFLAIAARQSGDYETAGERWQRILAGSDGTEPWLQIANAEFMRIAEATGSETPAGIGPRIDAPTGPLAGNALPPAVVAMVEGLAARLASEGGTAEEWVRLVRSLNVLGRTADAKQAVADGLAALDGEAREKFAAAPEVKEVER